jgi:hypothetical protein
MLGRRGVIGAGLAVGLLSGLGKAQSGASTLTDDFVRVRCSQPGRWGVWVYRGVLIGKVEGERAHKLLHVEGMSYNKAVRQETGGYEYHLDEAGYYCDLVTGEPVSEAVNPMNGKTVKVQHYRSPQRYIFKDGQVQSTNVLPPGTEFVGEITQPTVIGNRVFVGEDIFAKVPAAAAENGAPARPLQVATSMVMFSAALEDLQTQSDRWVPAEATYNTMNTFRPWLEMGDTPGVMNMRLEMVKFQDERGAPEWLRTRIAKDHPDFFDRRTA